MNSKLHITYWLIMKTGNLTILILLILTSFSCVSINKISRHDFDTGYFKLKSPEVKPEKIYADLTGDSITVFSVTGEGRQRAPEILSSRGMNINNIRPGSFLNNSVFIKNSLDIDLSTVLIKYRFESSGVPNQLNANLNGALYLGFRKDYYSFRSKLSPLNVYKTQRRHIGFDAGVFAGLGITPVNYTVTNNHTMLEYDGIVFQKGIAGFITIEFMSVGIALGFDNLLDGNSKYWVFNQKPWIGLVLGIANF
jgi:hypothetical protein